MTNTLVITAGNIEFLKIIGLMFVSSILSMPFWAYSMFLFSKGKDKVKPYRIKDALATSITILIYATVFGIGGYIATSITIAVFGIFLLITAIVGLLKYYSRENYKLINVNI